MTFLRDDYASNMRLRAHFRSRLHSVVFMLSIISFATTVGGISSSPLVTTLSASSLDINLYNNSIPSSSYPSETCTATLLPLQPTLIEPRQETMNPLLIQSPAISSSANSASQEETERPTIPTILPRPSDKPLLLTQFEYETMWDANMSTMRLGVLLALNAPFTEKETIMARKAFSVIRLAVNDINEQQIIPGINVSIIVRDSQDPGLYSAKGASAAVSGAGKLISAKVSGVIGDVRSELTRFEALMTSSVGIPQCSFASASTALSDSTAYPYFYRTIPTLIPLLGTILELIKRLGIHILGAIPLSQTGVPFDPTYARVKKEIVSSRSRIQVLIATGQTQYQFLREMKASGFMNQDFAWVTMNEISSLLKQEPDFSGYDGIIMVDNGWSLPGYKPYEDFLHKWSNLDPKDYPGAGISTLENNEGMTYSCVMMMANAYGNFVRRNIPNPEDRAPANPLIRSLLEGDYTDSIDVTGAYQEVPYEGPNGPILLDSNGDRHGGMPPFKDGGSRLPDDAPPSAVENPRWYTATGAIYGAFTVIGICLTLVSAVLVIYFRNHIIIKASSPTFCISELAGILLIFVWCIIHVGIPDKGICCLQSFALPVGVTLLTGIFNSVSMTNKAFQTRVLIHYLALAVFLSLIPIIVEMIVEIPDATKINIRSYQWVRCKGFDTQTRWLICLSIVPAVLILFGVFLAFRTRNVVSLWNEAKQIAFVIYNIFFFAIIIVVARLFPEDLYLATFYITITSTYFVALISLFVLFVPKFWRIYKSRNRPWYQDAGHRSNQISQSGGRNAAKFGFGGNGAAILGRLPEHFRTSPSLMAPDSAASRERGEMSGTGATFQSATDNNITDFSNSGAFGDIELRQLKKSPARRWSVAAPATTSSSELSAKTDNRKASRLESRGALNTQMNVDTGQSTLVDLEFGANSKLSRTMDEAGPSNSTAFSASNSGRIPATEIKTPADSSFGNEGSSLASKPNNSNMPEILSNSAAATHPMNDSSDEALAQGTPPSRAYEDSLAELSTKGITGKPSSYLMVSMTKIEVESGLTLKIVTSQGSTLLIIFSSQAHLDHWMGLFTQQDLQVLDALSATFPGLPSDPTSLTSSYTNEVCRNEGIRRRQATVNGVSSLLNHRSTNFIGASNGTRCDTAYFKRHGSEGLENRMTMNSRNYASKQKQRPLSSGLRNSSPSIFFGNQNYEEALEQTGATTSNNNDGAGTCSNNMLYRTADFSFGTNNNERASSSGTTEENPRSLSLQANYIPFNRQHNSRQHSSHPLTSSTGNAIEDQVARESHRTSTEPQIQGNDVDKSPSALNKEHQSVEAKVATLSPATELDGTVPAQQLHHPLPQPISYTIEDSDDSDDLYDPEFGIGGGGRRGDHARRRHGGRRQTTSGDLNRVSGPGNAIIPSSAVISAAAAAVAAGWSESDALAAAMSNPCMMTQNYLTQSTKRSQKHKSLRNSSQGTSSQPF
ncbi:hypothetical protein BGX27_000323 [Mortierella sp. AM989]|nr:hypothetical protein BGX27_000323 [Mortierella sp. AM989]